MNFTKAHELAKQTIFNIMKYSQEDSSRKFVYFPALTTKQFTGTLININNGILAFSFLKQAVEIIETEESEARCDSMLSELTRQFVKECDKCRLIEKVQSVANAENTNT